MVDKKKSPLFLFSLTGLFLFKVVGEVYAIASRTGDILGVFSAKWGLLFVFSVAFFISIMTLLGFLLWKNEKLAKLQEFIVVSRKRLHKFSLLIAFILIVLVVWFFQYTLWGMVFTGGYFRVFVWMILIISLAVFLTEDDERIVSFRPLLVSILLSATGFTVASVFSQVKSYPFNLFWSEGNRLWDYSIMFGRDRYNYPVDQPIEAFISPGRQFLWGAPFLLPDPSIWFIRFWSAFVFSFPHMILGWIAFRTKENTLSERFLLGLWTFLFLNQGPIYTPLIISAILVAFVWGRPLWLAMPFVAFAGYYAQITRWHWEFAPSIWASMLLLSGINLKEERLEWRNLGRAIALAVAGISVWYLYPIIRKALENRTSLVSGLGHAVAGTVASVQNATSRQPLLWNRLLPNETYSEGILGGLLIAVLPLIVFLFFLLREKYWEPRVWQKMMLGGALLPFFVVGLIVSTKIGGGSNLHNLDMFLVALLFVAAIAWRYGGRQWFFDSEYHSLGVKIVLVALIALPAFSSLRGLRPNLSFSEVEIRQIQILTGNNAVNSLPSESEINDALWYIRRALSDAERKEGDVLFIDGRQLLTFGYVQQVPLVPEYEKKRMMDESMSGNLTYFAPYYQDLANHRFSLIISEPLKILTKEDGSFSEEGNVWAKWVAEPTLCFYEPVETLKSVYIQLLVPRSDTRDCSQYLP